MCFVLGEGWPQSPSGVSRVRSAGDDDLNRSAQCRAEQLYTDLARIAERDPEQEVRGIAVPVLDARIEALREVVADDPVVSRMQDVISTETVEAGEPIRAVDALVVLGQIIAVIGPCRQGSPEFVRSGFVEQVGHRGAPVGVGSLLDGP